MYMFDFASLRFLHRQEFVCLLDLLSKLGYTGLGLYIEGAFLPDGQKGAVREDVITQEEADWIRAEAEKRGISVLPMTNVLYHMEHYLCQERYAFLRRSGPNERYLINYEHSEAVPFALGIIRSLADMFHARTVHIGMDEFPFVPDEIPAIGQYIAAVTGQMLEEGLTPEIWGDMFWMEPSLTAYLPRETGIYDWNYYGHRPESLRYFHSEGFRKVIAVPSDNGWEGFTGCQRATGYLRAREDIPVAPGEVEAFLADAVAEKADGCMLANWGNTAGRSVWFALAPAARAGLWMQGKWDPRAGEVEQVEQALFGRITPYTSIICRLRELQMHVAPLCHIRLPQDALYRPECMQSLLNKPADFWVDTIEMYTGALPEMEDALAEWTPESQAEQYARAALKSVVTNVRAARALMLFSQSRTDYRRAAAVQFSDPETFHTLLEEVEKRLVAAIEGMEASQKERERSIADTGITRQDLKWQQRLIAYLQSLRNDLKGNAVEGAAAKSLPAFTEFVYRWEFGHGGYVAQ